jgi:hypothetical protein
MSNVSFALLRRQKKKLYRNLSSAETDFSLDYKNKESNCTPYSYAHPVTSLDQISLLFFLLISLMAVRSMDAAVESKTNFETRLAN